MNKYRLFRWVSTFIGYIIRPMQKVLQILSYFRFIRMLMIIIAFILGLFTDSKVLKSNLIETTALLYLNWDTILVTFNSWIQYFSVELNNYISEHLSHNREAVMKETTLQQSLAKSLDKIVIEEESSWVSDNKWKLILLASITAVGILLWICNGSDPSTPGAIAEASTSTILKGKGPEVPQLPQSSYLSWLTEQVYLCKESTVNGYHSAVDWHRLNREEVTEFLHRVKTGDFNPVDLVKSAAMKSAESGSLSVPDVGESIASSSSGTVTPRITPISIPGVLPINPLDCPVPESIPSSSIDNTTNISSALNPNAPSFIPRSSPSTSYNHQVINIVDGETGKVTKENVLDVYDSLA